MNTTKYHDENADSITKKIHPCVARGMPSKSPLKALNDARRLTSSPQGIQDAETMKTPRTSPYMYIRQLDSAERWIERTSVVTKQDHLINMHNAESILGDLISSLPLCTNNEWIQKSLSDSSGGGTTLPSSTFASEQCVDVDSLADMLCDLSICRGVANVGEAKCSRDDSTAYTSADITEVGRELRESCDRSLVKSLDDSSECSRYPEKVCINDSNLEDNIHKVSADESFHKVIRCDGIQLLNNGNESCSVIEMNQPIEMTRCGFGENSHCISKNEVCDKNAGVFKHEIQLLNSSICNQKAAVNEEEAKDPILENPFKPKVSMMSSPVVEQKAAVSEEVKDTALETDPFKPNVHLMSSPVVEQKAAVSEEVKDTALETDPFKPKLQLISSPVVEQKVAVSEEVKDTALETDPFKPKLQLISSPVVEQKVAVSEEVKDTALETDPFKPKLQLISSPVVEQKVAVSEEVKDTALETDPFKPNVHLMSSPVVEQKAAVSEEVKDTALETDPFKPKLQLISSPVVEQKVAVSEEVKDTALETDPFKPKLQLISSPVVEQKVAVSEEVKDTALETDPFKPKLQLISSPVVEQKVAVSEEVKDTALETDPFKPKLQLISSPVVEQKAAVSEEVKDTALETDPFKPKLQLSSPVVEQKVAVSEEVKDTALETDPFKPKLQLISSPVVEQKVAVSEKVKDTALETDPFKPKLQLISSPVVEQKVAVSEEVKDTALETDPFKPKLQLISSPVVEQKAAVSEEVKDTALETDPFKPMLQLSSPVVEQKVAVSEEVKDTALETDPFKPKLQLISSPVVEQKVAVSEEVKDTALETDPFKPKLQLISSPVVEQKVAVSEEVKDTALETDPFKPKLQLISSPVVEQKAAVSEEVKDTALETDPFKPKLQLSSPVVEQKVAVSEEVKDTALETDPFKPKLQLISSPVVEQKVAVSEEGVKDSVLESWSLTPKLQLMNSPTSKQQAAVEKEIAKTLSKSNIQVINRAAVRNEMTDCGYHVSLLQSTTGNIDHLTSTDIDIIENMLLDSSNKISLHSDVLDISKSGTMFESKLDIIEGTYKLPNDTHEIDRTKIPDDLKIGINNVIAHNSEGNIKHHSLLEATPDFLEIDPFQSTKRLNSPISINKLSNINDSSTELTPLVASPTVRLTVTHENTREKVDIFTDNLSNFVNFGEPHIPKFHHPGSTSNSGNEITPSERLVQEIHTGADITTVSHDTNSQASVSLDLYGSIQPVLSESYACSLAVDDDKLNITSHVGALCEHDKDPFKPSSTKLENCTKETECGSTDAVVVVSAKSTLRGINSPEMLTTNNLESEINECNLSAKIISTIQKSETCNKSTESISSHEFDVCDLKVSTATNAGIGKVYCDDEQVLSVCNKNAERSSKESLPEDKNITLATHLPVDSNLEGTVDFMDSEFIPATQAFNDPSFFDMLEKSSNSCTLNPKRGSVLMKFDPLQEQRDQGFVRPASPGPIRKANRISDAFNLSKTCADDSVCLFGTPPRVSRRRTLTRKVHNTRAHIIEEEAAAAEVDMIFGLDDDSEGMDTILHDNLMPFAVSGARLVDVEEYATYTESEVKQIKAELTVHYQGLLLKKDKEFQEKLKQQEEIVAQDCVRMKAESDTYKGQIKSLQGKLKDLSDVMKEYADLITQVSAEKEKVLAEDEKLKAQITEMHAVNIQLHVDNKELEKSFDDLFHRYEKLKSTLEKVAQNEKVLKQAIQEAHEKYNSSKETAKKIKEVAEAKITELEDKCEKLNVSSKDDVVRLEATIKRKEMQIKGLETSLEQKIKENKELSELCDQLINKVSHSKKSS